MQNRKGNPKRTINYFLFIFYLWLLVLFILNLQLTSSRVLCVSASLRDF